MDVDLQYFILVFVEHYLFQNHNNPVYSCLISMNYIRYLGLLNNLVSDKTILSSTTNCYLVRPRLAGVNKSGQSWN